MELLNVAKAQSVWLFDMNDLNPRGKHILPDLMEWLKDRYEFQQVPKSADDLDETKGLAFKRGSFPLGNDELTVDATIYTDGIIANTWSSTRATDLFLEDALSSAAEEFALKYSTDLARSKTYLSEITIHMEGSLTSLNPKLAEFADKISRIHGHKGASPFEFGGLSFWSDVSAVALKFAAFALERKANTPFSENRYFSRAPLHTDDHVKLLEDFELLLAR